MRHLRTFLQSTWAAPIFLLPFLLMLAVHQCLGLSDALLAADRPGTRPAHGYNLLLGINMNLCPLFALLHLLLPECRRSMYWVGVTLLIPTSLFLIGYLIL